MPTLHPATWLANQVALLHEDGGSLRKGVSAVYLVIGPTALAVLVTLLYEGQ